MPSSRNRFWLTLAGLSLVFGGLVGSYTQISAASPHAMRPFVMRSAVVPAVASGHAARIGVVPADRAITFMLALQMPRQAAERAYVQSVYERNSPDFHHFLSPAQMTARFSPTAAAQQAVTNWLRLNGLSVVKTYPDRLIIDASGPAAAIDRAFHVSLDVYRTSTVRSFYANDRGPTVPAVLSGKIQNVLLDDFPVGHSNAISLGWVGHKRHLVSKPIANPAHGYGNGNPRLMRRMVARDNAARRSEGKVRPAWTYGYIDPPMLWSSEGYDVYGLFNQGRCCNPLGNPTTGSPVDSSIDVVSACDYDYNNSLVPYYQHYGMAWNIHETYVDGGPAANSNCANSSNGGFETTLDAEQSMAMGNDYGAYQRTAQVHMYISPAQAVFANKTPGMSGQTFFDLWNAAYSANDARIMSMSWGGCEPNNWGSSALNTGDGILSTMAGAGYSIFIAAGDSGAYECGTNTSPAVQFPGSDPNVTSVGGTQFQFDGSNNYISESAWNGGGGGCSSYFNAPTYQKQDTSSAGITFNNGCSGKRSQPDISWQSGCAPGEAIYDNSSWGGVCGTSDAAPAMAGVTAMIDAYSISQGSNCGSGGNSACAPVGLMNWYMWNQGIRVNYAPHQPFYDITTGNNNDGTGSGFYNAGTGYDLATGWGSPNALQLYRSVDYYHTWDNHGPVINFGGVGAGWYNYGAEVTWTDSDPVQGGDPAASGLDGFTQGWDGIESDSYHLPTPGAGGDSFRDGPEFPNATSGYLYLPTGSQGCHTAYVRAWDNTGQSTLGHVSGLCYDSLLPHTTSIGFVPASPTNHATVQIQGAATDPGCGSSGSCVNRLEYFYNTAINGTNTGSWVYLGSSSGASGSFNWNTSSIPDGTHLIAVDPVDNAGNSASCAPQIVADKTQCGSIQLDKVAPATTILLNGNAPAQTTYKYPVLVSLTANDPAPGTGVSKTYFRIDNGPWNTYAKAFNLYSAGTGTHAIQYYSTDKAGNSEATHTLSVKVKPPAKTFTLTDEITKSGGAVRGTVAMSYAGLDCALAKCVYHGIVPSVMITFTETANFRTHPFQHWVVNGVNKGSASALTMKIKKNDTVIAVFKK